MKDSTGSPKHLLDKTAAAVAPFGGDWRSGDAITVAVEAAGEAVNKVFTGTLEAIKKDARGTVSDAYGIVVGVPTPEAMEALLNVVGVHPAMYIVGGRSKDAVGVDGHRSDVFRMVSKAKRDTIAPTEGTILTTRTKDKFEPVNWLLFDCDASDDAPEALANMDYETEWWPAMVGAFPGLEGVPRVTLPSSSSRLVTDDGAAINKVASSHTWVQVENADLLPEMRWRLLYQAALSGIGFMRKWGDTNGQLWSVFDPTVYSPERCVFDGAPSSYVPGAKIAPPKITVYPGTDGKRFDLESVPEPTDDDLATLSEQFGLRFETTHFGGVRTILTLDEDVLTPDTALTVRDDAVRAFGLPSNTVTLAELHAAACAEKNPVVRIQAIARDSTSWACTVYLAHDRMPFVVDFGSANKWQLSVDSLKTFDEAPYVDALRHAILGGNDDRVQWAAATYAAVMWYKGVEPKDIRASVAGFVKDALKTDPDGFHPTMETKARNNFVFAKAIEVFKAIDRKQNSQPDDYGGPIFDSEDDVAREENKRFIFGLIGKKPRVIEEVAYTDPKTGDVKYIAEDYESGALRDYHAPRRAAVSAPTRDDPTKVRLVKVFDAWLYSSLRNTATRVHFYPECTFRGGPRTIQQGGVYNLWQGFLFDPVEPGTDPEADAAADMIEWHLRVVIAAGYDERHSWMMDWFANLIQKPASVGICIPVWKSREGAGKNTVMNTIFSPLFGWHYFEVSKLEDMTGRFNAMRAYTAFLVGNEATWGGDKKATGAIKALGDEHVRVEEKFKEAQMILSMTKVLLMTNEDWFAPDGLDGRRFVSFDVADDFVGDVAYFTALREACIRGRGVFLHRLLHREYDDKTLRNPPGWASDSGLKNKLAGETAFTNWMHDLCDTGRITVPEVKLTYGKYNVCAVSKWKDKTLDIEDVPHLLDDRLEGSVPSIRRGVVTVEFDDLPKVVSTDVMYASYLHYAESRSRSHKFSGSVVDEATFGKELLKLTDDDGRVVVRKRRRKTVRLDRYDGHGLMAGSQKHTSEFRVYELEPLPRLREAFQNTSRITIGWNDTLRDGFEMVDDPDDEPEIMATAFDERPM